jgi:hypothetical protein
MHSIFIKNNSANNIDPSSSKTAFNVLVIIILLLEEVDTHNKFFFLFLIEDYDLFDLNINGRSTIF